ncbi:helix-turn-helix domain-containing protein [Ferdinandcohnia quinoae]|uniref:Helix-turn-helix domain-containing protein n=1 Tax=Fredinandcohnia quinoae TaxID=2918902 RepID=A0AAW5E3W6_9BACI|nr:helix-turn-helix domain-containing protein [Fredinandcohnia sp. SECRCQ15]
MNAHILESYVVDNPEQAKALLNPLRGEIIGQLTEPASATEVAKAINETPQRVNYHLKTLEKVGLVKQVGTRHVRNLIEVLYLAVAKSFIMSDSLGWSHDAIERLKDQSSLAHLITISERIRKDALSLLEQSEQNIEIPSASLQTKIVLPEKKDRNAFLNEYVKLVKQLVEKYQVNEASDENYNVMLSIYPEPTGGTNNDTKE